MNKYEGGGELRAARRRRAQSAGQGGPAALARPVADEVSQHL